MIFLSRRVNTEGLQEVQLNTLEDKQKYVGGYITALGILDTIVIWSNDYIAEPSLDNLNLILKYGADSNGKEIETYIFGDCYFASKDVNGKSVPLSSGDLRMLLGHKESARLKDNGHTIWVINAVKSK